MKVTGRELGWNRAYALLTANGMKSGDAKELLVTAEAVRYLVSFGKYSATYYKDSGKFTVTVKK